MAEFESLFFSTWDDFPWNGPPEESGENEYSMETEDRMTKNKMEKRVPSAVIPATLHEGKASPGKRRRLNE